MSIVDREKTANHITKWIKDYATSRGIQTLVLGLSGGIDSALVALLCKRTGLPLFCVNMPCHSSSTAYDRAKAFADAHGIFLHKIDLSAAHEVIMGQANAANPPFTMASRSANLAVGGLRSCLRAPTLSYFANATRGIIVGTGNRSEDNITRYFQKYGDGCVDISPISDLFKSEVYELFAYLSADAAPISLRTSLHLVDNNGAAYYMHDSAKTIYDAKPTADLWGPDSGQEDEKELGISYDEIEWADREDTRTKVERTKSWSGHPMGIVHGIIFSDDDPAKTSNFSVQYTGRQQQVIAKLHAMEKASRHKVNPNLPMCKVRSVPGLVK